MRPSIVVSRLLASAFLVCASSASGAAAQAQSQFGTPQFEGKQTINQGAVAIESTLLASTAVDAAAQKIADHVKLIATANILVIGAAENLDFSPVAMIQTEMAGIQRQILSALKAPPKRGARGSQLTTQALPIASLIPAVAGIMRSDVELTAHDVSFDARVLPSAVAQKLGKGATLFSAAVGAQTASQMLTDFEELYRLAEQARVLHDQLAPGQSDAEKRRVTRLASALTRYDDFAKRVTSPDDKGVVPLAAAARLSQIIEQKPVILRVNTEKVGGTTVKRTNLLTFLGADGLSISGGLVASYQLTEPQSGAVSAAGVITCRTTLTRLRTVQDASWAARGSQVGQTAVCTETGYPPRISADGGSG